MKVVLFQVTMKKIMEGRLRIYADIRLLPLCYSGRCTCVRERSFEYSGRPSLTDLRTQGSIDSKVE